MGVCIMGAGSKLNPPSDFNAARDRWQKAYLKQMGKGKEISNRSGIPIEALYTPANMEDSTYMSQLGFPGEYPFTRGIYPSMHRGRTWTQRQLIGLGTPKDYNERALKLLDAGASAISLLPCCSGFRGLDCDEVPAVLLGTCGTVVNTIDHMQTCLEGVPIEKISTAMNDPSPFTLMAFLLGVAKRRGIPWTQITGTSNQSDYISHFVANHMFYRLSLSGSRRMLMDHIAFCLEQVPNWNPVSVVGQHMQQAGATPAETMGFTLSTAIQFAEDCLERGMDIDTVLPRFTFFFDISISFFEEIAKFRAGRRLWARIAKKRLGATDPRSWRFKFHGQTSGVDLTRQQPLNNIARVTTQAIAGILSGLQSMHTDAYDEAISCPTEEAAQIAVATQNILREEAHVCEVIDPLGGSYYIETLTDQMEAEINDVINKIDEAGGIYNAVSSGMVQTMIGESALTYQKQIDTGEQKWVGVNCYTENESTTVEPDPYRPDPADMNALVDDFKILKATRSQSRVQRAIDDLARAANSDTENIFDKVVTAVEAGVTHGEIVSCLRQELGYGDPLIIA